MVLIGVVVLLLLVVGVGLRLASWSERLQAEVRYRTCLDQLCNNSYRSWL